MEMALPYVMQHTLLMKKKGLLAFIKRECQQKRLRKIAPLKSLTKPRP